MVQYNWLRKHQWWGFRWASVLGACSLQILPLVHAAFGRRVKSGVGIPSKEPKPTSKYPVLRLKWRKHRPASPPVEPDSKPLFHSTALYPAFNQAEDHHTRLLNRRLCPCMNPPGPCKLQLLTNRNILPACGRGIVLSQSRSSFAIESMLQ